MFNFLTLVFDVGIADIVGQVADLCGNSSKARKGTSRYPVAKLFGRALCEPSYLRELRLPVPARESGGPLSTGEGLAYHVRELSDAEVERLQRQNPEMDIRDKGDKRLIIMDEEFANGLACTKREGNTLSMGIRCFCRADASKKSLRSCLHKK